MLSGALQSVLTLLILITVGYFVSGLNWFGETGASVFSKFCVNIVITCYMFFNVIDTTKTRDQLFAMFSKLPIPVFTILLCLLIGFLLASVLKIPSGKRGVFINAVTFSNTIIIGFPLIEAIYGSEALPILMIYYMANTTIFWTIGVFLLQRDNGKEVKLLSLKGLRSIFAPPMLAFLMGVVFVIFNIPVPGILLSPLVMLKQMTTPMAMIFIGSIIRQGGLKSLKLNKNMISVLLVRFILTPLLVFLVCSLLPLDPLTKKVFIMLSAMPAMTQLGIMAKERNSDYHYASAVVTVTTIVSLVIIPLYTALFDLIF